MEGNKITKSLNVAEGCYKSAGRKYPLTTVVHQESGGYQGMANHRHKIAPSDKALEASGQRKIGQWGVSESIPKAARIDLELGSFNRGSGRKANNNR